jgi:hypothetical protein
VAKFCDTLAKKDVREGLRLYPEKNNAIEEQGIDVVLANLPAELKAALDAENHLANRMRGKGLVRVETLVEIRVWIDERVGAAKGLSKLDSELTLEINHVAGGLDLGPMHSSRKRQWSGEEAGKMRGGAEGTSAMTESTKRKREEDAEETQVIKEDERERKWEERERQREEARREDLKQEDLKREKDEKAKREDQRRADQRQDQRDKAERRQRERSREEARRDMKDMVKSMIKDFQESSEGMEKKRDIKVNAFTAKVQEQMSEGRREREELREDRRSDRRDSRTMGGTGSKRVRANPPRSRRERESSPTRDRRSRDSDREDKDDSEKVCRIWDRTGKCNRKNCPFAHKGKIELCRDFNTSRGCTFGKPSCWFRHEKRDESGKTDSSRDRSDKDKDRKSDRKSERKSDRP